MAKIVIIDDEAAILKLMTQLCEGLGHAVHATQSGTDGVDAIKTERPDLLIVDLRIGDKSGLEIIEMCANEALEDTPPSLCLCQSTVPLLSTIHE